MPGVKKSYPLAGCERKCEGMRLQEKEAVGQLEALETRTRERKIKMDPRSRGNDEESNPPSDSRPHRRCARSANCARRATATSGKSQNSASTPSSNAAASSSPVLANGAGERSSRKVQA